MIGSTVHITVNQVQTRFLAAQASLKRMRIVCQSVGVPARENVVLLVIADNWYTSVTSASIPAVALSVRVTTLFVIRLFVRVCTSVVPTAAQDRLSLLFIEVVSSSPVFTHATAFRAVMLECISVEYVPDTCFPLRAVCVAVEIGLSTSEVLSTFPRPTADLLTKLLYSEREVTQSCTIGILSLAPGVTKGSDVIFLTAI
jgi:hypothetical protein